MIKAKDLGIDLSHFETSITWDYGEYKLLESDIRNFGAREADGTINTTVAQRILDVHVNKALGQIKRDIDKKGILSIFEWSNLDNTRFKDNLVKVIEAQLSGMITDGNKEIKSASSYSASGVETGTEASGYLLSSDRLYKETEDRWYEYQLDKYDVEFNESSNSYSLIDNADATIKQVVAQVFLTQSQLDAIANNLKNDPNFKASVKGDQGNEGKQGVQGLKGDGINWLTDNYADLTDFGNNAKDYEIVKYNLNKDGSNNAEGIVLLVKVGSEVKEFRTWEETIAYVNSQILLIKNEIEADDFEKLKKILDFTFSTNTNGGAASYVEHFGDLDDTTTRQNFMDNVKINNWYTFNIGGNPYQVVITSGDKTSNYQWVGKRIIDGPLGKTPEIVKGSTSTTGHAETSAGLTGEFFSNTLALPGAYSATQMLPKSAIEQMILDNNDAIATDETDPTWRDLDGTQTTQFNPSQIVITLTDSGLAVDDNIQLLLGSNVGNLVLDGSVKIYNDVTDASRNGNVAGSYKWYAYAVSATEVKFIMEDSTGGLTDTSQAIAKIRTVSPDKQRFTGHYTSQAALLKGAVNITAINTGASQEITLPAGLTIDNLTGIALTVSGSTDWYEVEGWDKVTAFYVSVTNEASNQVWWVEYKIEAVPGDKTKLKVTNFKSGNVGTDNSAYNAHWIAFKGGK